ncbi:unnamed protein product, partial [Closterium sp. Yama58-4]
PTPPPSSPSSPLASSPSQPRSPEPPTSSSLLCSCRLLSTRLSSCSTALHRFANLCIRGDIRGSDFSSCGGSCCYCRGCGVCEAGRPRSGVTQPLTASASRVFGRSRCPKFPVSLVEQATDGWSEVNRVEEQGWSSISGSSSSGGQRYKAVSPLNARQVWFVVRRGNDELSTDFQKEVATLWSIRHTNLQRLLGYCWEKCGSADSTKSTASPAAAAADASVHCAAAAAVAAAASGHAVEQAEEQVLVFEWVPGGNLHSCLVAGSITANLRAAHLPSAPDAMVLPMVRLALSCTASDPLSRPTVTDLLRSIKALKRSLSALPRAALPPNAGASGDGDMQNAAGGKGAAEQQGGEHRDVVLGNFSQNALDAKLDWLLEEEDSGSGVLPESADVRGATATDPSTEPGSPAISPPGNAAQRHTHLLRAGCVSCLEASSSLPSRPPPTDQSLPRTQPSLSSFHFSCTASSLSRPVEGLQTTPPPRSHTASVGLAPASIPLALAMAADETTDGDDEARRHQQKSLPRTGLSFLQIPAKKLLDPEPVVASTEDEAHVDEAGRDLRSPEVCTTTTEPEPPEVTAPETEIGDAAGDSANKKRKESSSGGGKPWWRQPKPSSKRSARPIRRVEDAGSDDDEDDDGLPTVEEMARYPEIAFAKAHKRFKTSWESLFPWLILTRDDVGFPILRCSTCLEHGAEGAKTAYGKGGSGGRDMQKGSIRTHQRSTAHQDAHAEMKSKLSRKLRQTMLSEFEGLDRSTHHIITALKTTVFICKSEAPITSYVGTIKFMAELGVPNLPLDSKGNYFSEEALAAKDAAEKVTEFNIIDQAVRNVAEQLSSNYSSHPHSQVDITVVAGEVSLACRTIEVRYVDCEDRFGNDQSPLLCAFLKKHGNPEHREVTVNGVDQNGDAAEHKFVLHERKFPGHTTGGDYYSCKAVCQEFARVCVARLEFRLEDLKDLAGSKLFRPSCYPDDNEERMKKCREWLRMLDRMFRHRLFAIARVSRVCVAAAVLQEVAAAVNIAPFSGWAADADCLLAKKISCDAQGMVDHLNIGGLNLNGTIPSSISKLTALSDLDVSTNNFIGNIPSFITLLSQLYYLTFDRNQISGPIPSTITALKNLRALMMAHTNITGTIPSHPHFPLHATVHPHGNALHTSDFSDTHLSGTIPGTIGQLANLAYLNLAHTNLSGSLPASLGALSKLTLLNVNTGVACGRAGSSCEIQQNASSFFCRALCFEFCASCIPLNVACLTPLSPSPQPSAHHRLPHPSPSSTSASRVFGRPRCPKFPVSLVAQATGVVRCEARQQRAFRRLPERGGHALGHPPYQPAATAGALLGEARYCP